MIAKLRKFVCHPVMVFLLTFLVGWLTLEQINGPMPDETIAIPHSSGHYAEITHANDTHLLVCAHFTQGVKTRFGWPGKEREYVVDTSTKVVTPIPKVGKRDGRRWLNDGKLACLDFVDDVDKSPKLSIRVFDPKQKTIKAIVLPSFTQKLWSDDGSTLVLAQCSDAHSLIIEVISLENGIFQRNFVCPGRIGGIDTAGDKIAATAWALSADGKFLALAEAWESGNRVSPQGVESIHLPTMRNVCHSYIAKNELLPSYDPKLHFPVVGVSDIQMHRNSMTLMLHHRLRDAQTLFDSNIRVLATTSIYSGSKDEPISYVTLPAFKGAIKSTFCSKPLNADQTEIVEDTLANWYYDTEQRAYLSMSLPTYNPKHTPSDSRMRFIGMHQKKNGAIILQPGQALLSRLREQLSSIPLLDEIASKIGIPTDFENRGPYEFFWWDSSTDTLRQFHSMRSVSDDIGVPAIQPGKLWIMSNSPSGAVLQGSDLPPKPRSPVRPLVNLAAACLLASMAAFFVTKRIGFVKAAKASQFADHAVVPQSK